jgi:hypothetical protein
MQAHCNHYIMQQGVKADGTHVTVRPCLKVWLCSKVGLPYTLCTSTTVNRNFVNLLNHDIQHERHSVAHCAPHNALAWQPKRVLDHWHILSLGARTNASMITLQATTRCNAHNVGCHTPHMWEGVHLPSRLDRGGTSGALHGRGCTSGALHGRGCTSGALHGRGCTSGALHGRGCTSGALHGRGSTSSAFHGRGGTSSAFHGRG